MKADETFPTPLDELAFLLEEVPRSLRRKFDERTHAHGLSRTQWRILAYLLRDPGMSQTELAQSAPSCDFGQVGERFGNVAFGIDDGNHRRGQFAPS